jgi:hypothetical protein
MDKEYIKGGEIMIADELRELFDDIKSDITLVRNELLLLGYDITKIREQLDRIEQSSTPQQESIGIAPNTPGPDFMPPEYR